MLQNIFDGFGSLWQVNNTIAMFIGVAIGMVIGAIPGLSVTMAVALMLPLTFTMEPTAGMLMLIGIYCSGNYAGSISAILLKTPGTIAAAATAADGYALAKKGYPRKALNMALYASVLGGFLSGLVLLFFAPQVAKFGLKFGPPEYFMLALFGLVIIASISGSSLSKGLTMGAIGVFIGTIGLDPISGIFRFTFGQDFLLSGIDMVSALIGMFAISEILTQLRKTEANSEQNIIDISKNKNDDKFSFFATFKYKMIMLKSSIIGIIVGMTPGTGPAISSFLAYNEAKRTSKKPQEFGKGSLEGICAAESANNGTTGATMIPMMTLGIPGDVVTAVMLGALMIHGLSPGPQLFSGNASFVYTLMVGFVIIQFVMLLQGLLAIKWFSKITLIPQTILLPLIGIICLAGAYASTGTIYAVYFALIFGILGYILPMYGYPVVPLLLGLVLGPLAEKSFRQSLILSQGDFSIFITRPISIVFLVLIIISLISSLYSRWKAQKNINLKVKSQIQES